jgi:hypothetical protein
MAEEFEILDIWVGTFPSSDALSAYVAESYSEDDSVPISQLAADMQQRFYDHDFIERAFHESPSSELRSLLEPHSFAASYARPAGERFDAMGLPGINTILLVWGEQFDKPASVLRDDYQLHYLGRFSCDPSC